MTDRLRIIGLTGGIGAGKSEALAAFTKAGAQTISTDAVTHELLGTPEMRDLLVALWGEGVAPGGEVDRDRVSEVVFKDPDELKWLESQLHPRVGERIASWGAALKPGDVGVVEVPLLFEAGMADAFDANVAVIADEKLRGERAAARGHEGLEGREGRQLSQAEKAERADYVIDNDGTLEQLNEKVAALLPLLGAKD